MTSRPGSQHPGPRAFRASRTPKSRQCRPANLLRLGVRTPPERRLKIWGRLFKDCNPGFRVFPSRGQSMYIVYIWPTGVAGGRAVPPDVREEPRGSLYVHSP